MRYAVLAVGLLALAGVLAALILLPPPTIGPAPSLTPAASASVDPDVTAGEPTAAPTPAPPDAETGSASSEPFTPLDAAPTPQPTYVPTAPPASDVVVCDLIAAEQMIELTGFDIVAARAPSTAAGPAEGGGAMEAVCEYLADDGRALVAITALAPVDDVAAEMQAQRIAAAQSDLEFHVLNEEDGEPRAGLLHCPNCRPQTSVSGMIYGPDATFAVAVNRWVSSGADDAFIAIAAELLDTEFAFPTDADSADR